MRSTTWLTISLLAGLLSGSLAWGTFALVSPMGLVIVALALVAFVAVGMAVRGARGRFSD